MTQTTSKTAQQATENNEFQGPHPGESDLVHDQNMSNLPGNTKNKPKNKPKNKKDEESTWESLKTIVLAVLLALVVRTFAYEPFHIPSGSMLPTLLVGDYLFVSKFSYGYSRYTVAMGLPVFKGRVLQETPERGDVVVFKLPRDNRTDYIKRLIGMPGDKIKLINGRVYLNGEMLPRDRDGSFTYQDPIRGEIKIARYTETLPSGRNYTVLDEIGIGSLDNIPEFTVPPGHYFMMGDNRDHSQDSRDFYAVGPIPEENLVGRAEILFFSLGDRTHFWEIWKWPLSLRGSRLFNTVE